MSMETRNYPTRMHEALGVEGNERFRIAGYSRSEKFYLLDSGTLTTDKGVCYQGVLVEIINHPERIIRKPRLSEEQVKQFKALHKALKGQVVDIVQTLRDAGVEVDDG